LVVKSGSNQRNKRDNRRIKTNKYYDYYQRSGHTQDQCFKIIGYPDWYEGPREVGKGKRTPRVATNVISQTEQTLDSPLDEGGALKGFGQPDPNLVQVVA